MSESRLELRVGVIALGGFGPFETSLEVVDARVPTHGAMLAWGVAADFELLEAWRAGDRDAGSELFERHFESLRRFFRSKVSDGIEDLIQRTFLACLESKSPLRDPSKFRVYLFTIAKHELYRYLRTLQRARDADDIGMSAVEDIGPSPSKIVAQRKEHEVLLAALRRIPLDFQIVLELFYWEEMTSKELAEVLELPVGTVKSRIRRAKEALEVALRRLSLSPDLLESTTANLDEWARSLRDAVSPPDD